MNGVKWLAPALAAGVMVTGGGVALAAHHQADRVEFYKVTQNYPTNGIYRFIIKGDGCLKTEDMTKLRLVSYDPSHHKVIYRCIRP